MFIDDNHLHKLIKTHISIKRLNSQFLNHNKLKRLTVKLYITNSKACEGGKNLHYQMN